MAGAKPLVGGGEPEGAGEIARKPQPFVVRYWWITLIRGLLILTLGLGLALGANTRANVATFFGIYWLLTGGLAIRWALSRERERLHPLVLSAGFAGVATGVVVLSRRLFLSLTSAVFAVDLVGVTALLVGGLHIARAFNTEPLLARRWGWDSIVLGVLEVILGFTLLVDGTRSSWTIAAIGAWSIGGGIVLVLDAVQLRRVARRSAAG